jgi:hypothetical protein
MSFHCLGTQVAGGQSAAAVAAAGLAPAARPWSPAGREEEDTGPESEEELASGVVAEGAAGSSELARPREEAGSAPAWAAEEARTAAGAAVAKVAAGEKETAEGVADSLQPRETGFVAGEDSSRLLMIAIAAEEGRTGSGLREGTLGAAHTDAVVVEA